MGRMAGPGSEKAGGQGAGAGLTFEGVTREEVTRNTTTGGLIMRDLIGGRMGEEQEIGKGVTRPETADTKGGSQAAVAREGGPGKFNQVKKRTAEIGQTIGRWVQVQGRVVKAWVQIQKGIERITPLGSDYLVQNKKLLRGIKRVWELVSYLAIWQGCNPSLDKEQ